VKESILERRSHRPTTATDRQLGKKRGLFSHSLGRVDRACVFRRNVSSTRCIGTFDAHRGLVVRKAFRGPEAVDATLAHELLAQIVNLLINIRQRERIGWIRDCDSRAHKRREAADQRLSMNADCVPCDQVRCCRCVATYPLTAMAASTSPILRLASDCTSPRKRFRTRLGT